MVLLRRRVLQMRQDLRNDLRLLDAGNDSQLPPQRAQPSISMPKTRLSRRAQFIATWRGVGGLSCSPGNAGCFGAPMPRRAGVTIARRRLCGANTPWYLVKCIRGGGTSATRRAIRSRGSRTTCVVPSRYGVFSRVAHMARCGEQHTLGGHRRAAHVTAQAFELLALVRRDVNASVQGKPACTHGAVGMILLLRRPGWQRLQAGALCFVARRVPASILRSLPRVEFPIRFADGEVRAVDLRRNRTAGGRRRFCADRLIDPPSSLLLRMDLQISQRVASPPVIP